MNYRILFFISVLILIIGVGGLFMMPNQQSAPQAETNTEVSIPKPEKKTIKVAVARHSMVAGSILKEGDYHVSEMEVEADSALVKDDVSDVLARNNNSLDGLLVSEPVLDGRFLPPEELIASNDERFLFYTVGKGEVIYRVYIRKEHQFSLDTLKSGDIIGLFALQQDFEAKNSEQMRFDPILQNLEVVKIDRFDKEDENGDNKELKEYAGYVSVRMNADKVKDVLSLTKSRALLVLPQSETVDMPMNKRGLSIRSLRGKRN